VRHDAWAPGQTALLAAAFLVLTGLWFAVLTVGIARARQLMDNVTVRRWIDRVAGTAFVGFGVRLAVAARG
jgi:threonine/homoserine/homoserine lactone efflux protein